MPGGGGGVWGVWRELGARCRGLSATKGRGFAAEPWCLHRTPAVGQMLGGVSARSFASANARCAFGRAGAETEGTLGFLWRTVTASRGLTVLWKHRRLYRYSTGTVEPRIGWKGGR